LRARRRGLFDVAHVLEQGEDRINHAGARDVQAAGQFLDRADELIAMARLVGDQLEQDQAKLARIEDPPAPAAARVVGLAPAASAEGMKAAVPGSMPVRSMVVEVMGRSH
jgi:hypothetical protein